MENGESEPRRFTVFEQKVAPGEIELLIEGDRERAIELGIVEPVDEATVRVLLPAVLRSGEAMTGLGVPLNVQVDVVQAVDEHVRAIAATYVELARQQQTMYETPGRGEGMGRSGGRGRSGRTSFKP